MAEDSTVTLGGDTSGPQRPAPVVIPAPPGWYARVHGEPATERRIVAWIGNVDDGKMEPWVADDGGGLMPAARMLAGLGGYIEAYFIEPQPYVSVPVE